MRYRTGVENLFDPIEASELERALNEGEAWDSSKFRLHVHCERMANGGFVQTPVRERIVRLGLASYVTGYRQQEHPRDVPWGWRRERCWYRDLYFIMPAWLYWIRRMWVARWYVMHFLASVGLLQAPEEGLEWSFHHWSWRVWESCYNRHGYRQRWFTWAKRCYEGLSAQSWN